MKRGGKSMAYGGKSYSHGKTYGGKKGLDKLGAYKKAANVKGSRIGHRKGTRMNGGGSGDYY